MIIFIIPFQTHNMYKTLKSNLELSEFYDLVIIKVYFVYFPLSLFIIIYTFLIIQWVVQDNVSITLQKYCPVSTLDVRIPVFRVCTQQKLK